MNKCIDKLKCSNCKNHLSYYPIYILPDYENICGRCESTLKTSSVYMRNKMYEILAKLQKFPCRYHEEGCEKKIIPSEIPSHEKSCTFRVSQCPTESITGCVEEVPNRDLIQHCQEKHSDFILQDYKFKLDLSHSYQIKNLLLHEDTVFIVTKTFNLENNTFECLINKLVNENNFKICSYRVNLTSDNRTFSINCAVDDCKNEKVCLDLLKNCDDDDAFLVFCEIIIENTNNSSNSTLTNCNNIHDQLLLVKFKCLSCPEYLIPPFSMYECNGTVTCSHCKGNNAFRLNDIAPFLNYPCIYQKNGCDFTCTSAEMENHKIFCSFANCECPVNEYVDCKWKGLSKDVMEHINKDHHEATIRCPTFFIFFQESFRCHLLKYSNRVFRLIFAKNGNKYIWSVQLIGHFAEKYKYEIEIFKTDKSEKLQLIQPCTLQPLIKKDEICQNKNGYSYFYDDQIQNFISFYPHKLSLGFMFKFQILT